MNTPDVNQDRLGRIETKLDKLSDAVVSLARMEERMVTLFKRMDKYDGSLEKVNSRIDVLEKNMVKGGMIARFFDKTFWIILGALITFAVKTFGG